MYAPLATERASLSDPLVVGSFPIGNDQTPCHLLFDEVVVVTCGRRGGNRMAAAAGGVSRDVKGSEGTIDRRSAVTKVLGLNI